VVLSDYVARIGVALTAYDLIEDHLLIMADHHPTGRDRKINSMIWQIPGGLSHIIYEAGYAWRYAPR